MAARPSPLPEGGAGLIRLFGLTANAARQVVVLVPTLVIKLNETHPALRQSPREKAVRGKGPRFAAVRAVEFEDAARLERKLRTASFDFNDFLAQFKMMRRMGPLENILGMLPGMSNVSRDCGIDEKRLKRTEAIVLSMTSEERTRPDILNARRRQRIARLSQLLLQWRQRGRRLRFG